MTEEREAKRVRQACQNCRRKKTRCSGEKPVCSFCTRLNQPCRWDETPPPGNGSVATSGLAKDLTLSTRVALLESKLSLLDHSSIENLHTALGVGAGDVLQAGNLSPEADEMPGRRRFSDFQSQHPSDAQFPRPWRKFSVLPPTPTLRPAMELYFKHCHNQPYCYFSQPYFFQRFDEGKLPSYLIMAVLAAAVRFSNDPFFDSQQQLATETYSRMAWSEIFERSFSDDDALNITVVQAANLLAVVDFTNGKHKLAWVKIGLAVRFAQSLGLPNEPPQGLTADEHYERVSTFWSVYLLDRLVSCSYSRPPTIADSDCAVMLPSDPTGVSQVIDPNMPTLTYLADNLDDTTTQNLNHFAHTIFMASVLGRINRYSLQQHRTKDIHPPWDSRSGYVDIYHRLLSFETFSDITISFPEAVDQWYTVDGIVDQPAAGHFIFSLVLYHLSHCLLHHPYLLHHKLSAGKSRVPPSFLKDTLSRAREHAQRLTLILRHTQKKGLSYASFYAYACMVAGTIHRLYSFHGDLQTAETSSQLLKFSVEFLESGHAVWSHYPRMATALKQFCPDSNRAKELVSSTLVMTPPIKCLGDPSFEDLWDLLDYGWLSDSAREISTGPLAQHDWSAENWHSPTQFRSSIISLDGEDRLPSDRTNDTAPTLSLGPLPSKGELDSWSGIDVGDDMSMMPLELNADQPWNDLVS